MWRGLLAAGVAALLAPAPAHGWQLLGGPGPAGDASPTIVAPAVGANGAGDALVAWHRTGTPVTLQVRRRAPGGDWIPATLPGVAPDGASLPAAAVAPDGTAVVAALRDGSTAIDRWEIGRNGAVEGPVQVTPSGGAPAAALLPDGRVLLAYRTSGNRIRMELRAPDGTWTTVDEEPADGSTLFGNLPTIHVDPRGAWVLAESRSPGGASANLLGLRIAAGDVPGGLVRVYGHALEGATSVSIAPDPAVVELVDGTAWFVLTAVRTTGSANRHSVVAVRRPVVGFDPPVELDALDGILRSTAAGDGSGAVHAMWAKGTALLSATAPAGASAFGAPVAQGAYAVASGSFQPYQATSGRGAAVLLRRGLRTLGVLRPPGAATLPRPDPELELGAVGDNPVLAPNGNGDVVAAWHENGVARPRVALLDGTPPRIDDLLGPGRVTAGFPGRFEAKASDAWSGVTLTWDFGGEGTATGAQVERTWATPGRRTVTVTATDGVGLRAQRTIEVEVVVAAGTGPGPAPGPAGRDRTAPVVDRLSLSRRRFAVVPRGGRVRGRRGTVATFRLSELADVRLSLAPVRGRGRALAVTRRLTAGTKRVALTGRAGSRALRPGRHRLTVTATDPAGNRSVARTLTVTVVRR